jgi:Tfp pilus assembly protein PilN
MSQVNLLPPELRQRQAVRRTTSLVILAGVGLLVLIGAFYLFQNQRLAGVEDDLAAQEAVNAGLQGQIADLQQYAQLQAELAGKELLVQAVYVNEVSWSSALLDVSRVIPDASYLTNMSGQIASSTAAPVAGAESTLIGSMSFTGVAGGTDVIATWLTRLDEVQGWVNAWVTSAQEDRPLSGIYLFTGGLDLTAEAATERGQGGVQ